MAFLSVADGLERPARLEGDDLDVPVDLADAITLALLRLSPNKPKPDTCTVKVFRGVKADTIGFLPCDLVPPRKADSIIVRRLAIAKSYQPDSTRIWNMILRNDSAVVMMHSRGLSQNLVFVKTRGTWAQVPTPPAWQGR